MPVQNAEIAAMFDQTADLLEIKGENQFRVRAYRRAARTVEGLPQSVRAMLAAQSDLSELPGIGKDLAGKIAAIVASGHFDLLDHLKKKLPGELGEMAALPGLGPKRAKHGGRREGASPDLHVVGLQDDAALPPPIVVERKDESLERQGRGGGHRNCLESRARKISADL